MCMLHHHSVCLNLFAWNCIFICEPHGYLPGENMHTVCALPAYRAAVTKAVALLWILVRNMFVAICPG